MGRRYHHQKPETPDPEVLDMMAKGAGGFLKGLQPRRYTRPGRRGSVKVKRHYPVTEAHRQLGLVLFDHLRELGCDLDFIIVKAAHTQEHPGSIGSRIASGAINEDGHGHSVFGRRIPEVSSDWMISKEAS